jgi:hypothetical protein
MAKLGRGSGRFWRPLIGAVVAYAVAVQGLLIAVGGFALPAHANQGAPAFELCLHDDQSSPEFPADVPDYSGCNHCILCFAGSHHALLETSPVLFHRVSAQIISDPWPDDKHRLRRLPPIRLQVREVLPSACEASRPDSEPLNHGAFG